MTSFEEKVLQIVRTIPSGHVMSYGQVALYTGNPNHAREAGAAMRSLGDQTNFPWWRVLNSEGRISIADNPDADAEMQQELLKKEGVEFIEPFLLDITRYRYYAEEAALRDLGLDDWITQSALHKYGKPTGTQSLGL